MLRVILKSIWSVFAYACIGLTVGAIAFHFGAPEGFALSIVGYWIGIGTMVATGDVK